MSKVSVLFNHDILETIDAIKDLIPEVVLNFNEDTITMCSMDSSHVVSCSFILDDFKEYICSANISIGISLVNLSKVLSCSSKDSDIRLSINDLDYINIFITYDNKIMNMSLKLMTIDEDPLEIPEINFDYILSISSKEFKSIITDLTKFGTECTFKLDVDKFIITSDGDIGSLSSSITQLVTFKKSGTNPLELKFSLKYITMFLKGSTLSNDVIINVSKEFPLMIQYGNVRYYLAPKMGDE